MGTLTAGIKEIFSSAKTTGSNVMLCGNDGTPDGHITMQNLASVLGVTIDQIYKCTVHFQLRAFSAAETGEYEPLRGYNWTIIRIALVSYDSIWTEFAIRCENSGNVGDPKICVRSSYINGVSSWKEVPLNAIQ